MCGLVSVISKGSSGFFKPQCEMFTELLYVDNFRGDDSTGVFMVDNSGDLELIKEASSAPDFIRHHNFDVMMRNAFSRGRAIIGHNRKATKGVINDDNAHPFVVDDKIVLVHNGTLYGDYQKLAGEGNTVDVDSHAIAHVIHQKGDDVEAALQEINGAFALIWFDMEKQTLNFIRNSQRPLHFLETAGEWLWASEKNMLDWMISRHNLSGKVVELEAGLLSSFHFAERKVEVSNKKLQLYKSSSNVFTYPNNSGAHGGYDSALDGMGVRHLDCGYSMYSEDDDDFIIAPLNDREALREAIAAMDRDGEPTSPFEKASQAIVRAAANDAPVIDPDKHSKPHINAAVTTAHRVDEERMAAYNHTHIPVARSAAIMDRFQEGQKYRVVCEDYQYVNRKDGKSGYLLYGWLDMDDSILVRMFLRETWDEMKILDWTTNKTNVKATLTGKMWRSFDDKDLCSFKGDGFIMMYFRDPSELMFDAPKKEDVNAAS